MKKNSASWIAFLLVVFFLAPAVRADYELLPESRDQQYRTFGLFIDNQTSILFEPTGNNVWLALGEQIPMVEFKDWYGKPQLVIFANVNAQDVLGGSTLLFETIDIRLGLSYEFSFNDHQRMSISLEHQSGHTSDNVQDQSIVLTNLGNEQTMFRYFHDVDDRFRLGATLKPYLGSDPREKFWGSDQFAEWFPWGTASTYTKPTPFIAGSMEQYGLRAVNWTYHIQAGVYFGNHMMPVYKPNVRLVVGYYNGVDPRLKYQQILNGFQRFYYVGAQVGL
jgi:hypothetical protein